MIVLLELGFDTPFAQQFGTVVPSFFHAVFHVVRQVFTFKSILALQNTFSHVIIIEEHGFTVVYDLFTTVKLNSINFKPTAVKVGQRIKSPPKNPIVSGSLLLVLLNHLYYWANNVGYFFDISYHLSRESFLSCDISLCMMDVFWQLLE